jgi:hypothetical protein
MGKFDDVRYVNEMNAEFNPIKKPSEKLKECKNLKELAAVYTALTRTEQTAMTALKDELKLTLK